jgi:hypothetical protein
VIGADGATGFDGAGGDVVAGVGTDGVEDVNGASVEIDGEEETVDVDALGGAFGEFVEVAETGPGHGRVSKFEFQI